MTKSFPLIELKGDNRDLGIQHGLKMRMQIEQTVSFYKNIFNVAEKEILEKARHFRKIIKNFNQKYADEIEGIAEGAGIDPLWIYSLNARSEIMTIFMSECTAIYTRKNNILAQNWDWAKELEQLGFVARIEHEVGHKILMMTEPGIIGKIGFNSSGIGVTLNFLQTENVLDGVPIHIMLRAILDSTSLNSVLEIVENAYQGKAGNIIVANDKGKYINFEFANDRYFVSKGDENFIHTNHYLSDMSLNELRTDEELASSKLRYKRAHQLLQNNDLTVNDVKEILSDQSMDLPICRPYVEDEITGNIGTVCSIIMELEKQQLHITRGNPFENEYSTMNL